jgi:hypothetical protein
LIFLKIDCHNYRIKIYYFLRGGGGGGGGAIFFTELDAVLFFLGRGGGAPTFSGGGGGAIFLPFAGFSVGGASFTLLGGGAPVLGEDSVTLLALVLLVSLAETDFNLPFGGGGGGGDILPLPALRLVFALIAAGGGGNGGATPFLVFVGGGGATLGFLFVTVALFSVGLDISAGVASTRSTTCEPLLATFKLANFSSAFFICNANA